jgi:uncharacterized protein YkwD
MKKLNNMIIMIFSITMIVFINGCGGSSSSSVVNSDSVTNSGKNNFDTSPYDIPPLDEFTKQTYLDAINNARATSQDCGVHGIKDAVPALTWDDALYKAAYEHSEDMAESNTFAHTGSATESDWTAQILNLPSGSTMTDRIENNGYTYWKTLGENIAAGSKRDTAQEAIDAWIVSDSHCVNLMNPAYKNVGMGHVEKDGTTYIHYWTQNFGSK